MNRSEKEELFKLRPLKASLDKKAEVMRAAKAKTDQVRALAIWEAIRAVVKEKGIDVSPFDGGGHDGAHTAAEDIEEGVNIKLKKTGFTCGATAIKKRLRAMCAKLHSS